MARVTFTPNFGEKAADNLFVDVVNPIGTGRHAKWTFNYNTVKSIDEGEIDVTTDQPLLDAVTDGKLLMTITDVDSLSDLGVKNFLASSMGFEYKVASGTNTAKLVVKLDDTTGQTAYVAAAGDQPFGVVAATVTTGNPVRIKTKPFSTVTVTCNGAVAVGDLVRARTDGKCETTTTKGDWVLGTALTAGTNTDISVQIDIKQVA